MANVSKDFYRILGLTSGADASAIDHAYRDLCRQIADEIAEVGDSPELRDIRAEIDLAFAVLKDPHAKAEYDELRHGSGWWTSLDADDLEFDEEEEPDGRQFFESVLRRFIASQHENVRAQETVDLTLPFEMAALGGRANLQLPMRSACPNCGGVGGEGRHAWSCADCASLPEPDPACDACGGRGWIVTRPCTTCRGQGWVAALGETRLEIPPGVSDGTLLPYPGFASRKSDGTHPRFIRIRVAKHPFFRRQGRDVVCRVPVSHRTAEAGSTILVRTLRGDKQPVTISPGTRSGTVVRLIGEGIESEGERGDQIVEIQVRPRPRSKSGGKS